MKRNKVEIEVWMKRNGYRGVDIQRDLGFKAYKTVFATLTGDENNRKVLSWLLKKGCPEKHLGISDGMSVAA